MHAPHIIQANHHLFLKFNTVGACLILNQNKKISWEGRYLRPASRIKWLVLDAIISARYTLIIIYEESRSAPWIHR